LICSPNTADFIVRSPLNSGYQLHICDSLCEKLFSSCKDDLAKIPGMPTTIANGEQFCSELFKEAKEQGSIVFDPKVEKACYDGVPLDQVMNGYCLPGQDKPKDNNGLSGGTIAAIVIPIVLVVLLLVVGAVGVGGYFYYKKHKTQKAQVELALAEFN